MKNYFKVILFIFLLVILSFLLNNYLKPYIRRKSIYSKYVINYVNNKYPNSSIEYIDNYSCTSEGIVPKSIDNCYITKYIIKYNENRFNLYITDRYDQHRNEITAYLADSDECINNILSSDGVKILDDSYSAFMDHDSKCVTVLKKNTLK